MPLDECGLVSRVPAEAWKNKAKTLITYSGLQTLVQGVLALSGFLIVRILNKPEYAAYTIAASLQTLLNALTDCGIGWGLTAPEIDRRVRAAGRESESLVGRVEGFDYSVRGPGGATLSGHSTFNGILMANARTVVLSGHSTVTGAVIANKIVLSGSGQIIHPPVTSP